MEPQAYQNPGTVLEVKREERVIHLADVFEILDKLVEREGYGTVRACVLARRGDPRAHCIVGNVYAELGVPLNHLVDLEAAVGAEHWIESWRIEEEGAFSLANYDLRLTRAAAWALLLVQKLQDEGNPWGTAVERTRGRAHVIFGTEYDETKRPNGPELYVHGDRIPVSSFDRIAVKLPTPID